jgi:carbon-monoxide dehydrogenase medium subunit
MNPFSYSRPRTVQEILKLLQKNGSQAKIIAGGTDLIVKMKKGILSPPFLIDITSIPELKKIEFNETDGLTIGAATFLSDIENSPLIRRKVPMVSDAAGLIGSTQIRNLGTIGGNICNASPAADLLPSLIALRGKVRISGQDKTYWENLENFFVGPGESRLRPTEMVTHIQIPAASFSMRGAYLKEGRIQGMDLAVVGVAIAIRFKENDLCEDASLVLGAVAPTPVKVHRAEELLKGKRLSEGVIKEASEMAAQSCRPITDVRSSADYRKKIVAVLVRRALEKTLSEARNRE